MDDVQFGQQLRAVRLEQGLTQEQLAERIGILKDKRISDYEVGRFEPNLSTIRRLAAALEVPAWRLLEDRAR